MVILVGHRAIAIIADQRVRIATLKLLFSYGVAMATISMQQLCIIYDFHEVFRSDA